MGFGGRGRSDGFTLIELMIVIAIIAIIAALAVPNLLASKLNANETSAIATKRNLVSAQAQVGVAGRIDADSDGKGEFGTFLEMSGGVGVRKGYTPGSPATADFLTKGPSMSPPSLSSVFAKVDGNGFATKSGFAFQILLPDAGTPVSFVHEVGPATAAAFAGGSGAVGVDQAEVVWCAYAQPLLLGGTGTRRFFTNQKGDIMQSRNEVAKGQGVTAAIAGNSAFLGTGITSATAVGTAGNDGDVWRVTN
jgi:prepilin-type N-terminal cleavage/methylation domain-containing protein